MKQTGHVTDTRNMPSIARTLIALVLVLCPVAGVAEVVLRTSVVKYGDEGTSPQGVYPGETLRYTIAFENVGTQTALAGSIVITNPLPEGTEYVDGTAFGADTVVTFSVDGENFAQPEALVIQDGGTSRVATAADYRSIRWTFQPHLEAGESGEVSFDLLIR